MTTRILPPEEWPHLAGTDAAALWPHLDPTRTRVLVVEDGEEIVGTWVFMAVVHAECVWVKPSHRGRVSVIGRLLQGLRDIGAAWGVDRVVTGATSPVVEDIIARLGGAAIPGHAYVLPTARQSADRQRGQAFHAQLETLLPVDRHPIDPAHDTAVGRALKTALQGDPLTAVGTYNAWAATAGYAPLTYLGPVADGHRVDIGSAVIEIDTQYRVRLVAPEGAVCPS